MLQINVMTDSARLVQPEANGPILGRLSQAGVRAQVSRRSKRCQMPAAMQNGQAMQQTDGAPAVFFSCTEGLRQNAIAHCVILG